MRPGPRWLSTIRFKAMALVVALAGTLVVFLATYFPARHIEAARGAMEDKAVTYAHLVSRQVESGVAFDDRQTVREVFGATAQDPDVRAIALYTASGGLLLAHGELAGGAPPRTDVDRLELASGATFVRVTAPVIAAEGPRGTLVLELGTDRLVAEARATRRAAAIVALGSLTAGFVVAWLMARSLARRLGAIARATRAVAEGDLSTSPLDDASADEVGQLARAFNAMSADIRGLVRRIREAGLRETERLDALVRARTGELDARNRDMRLVLDHVSQGLLLLDRGAVPAGERSAAINRWFGEPAPGATFANLLRPFDPHAAVAFELNWEQLLDGFLPAEVAIDQLPRHMQVGERAYELEYTPLMKGDAFERVIVMISDVTERRAVERAEAEQREVLVAFERVTEDRSAFLEFLDDSCVLVDRLCGAERPGLRDVQRYLHTLKGNASLHGLSRLAAFCHELEDTIVESRADLDAPSRRALRERWDALLRRIETLLGGRDEERLTVSHAEYRALVEALADDAPRDQLARIVAGWRLETAGARLARHGAHARCLAQELGKGPLAVSIEGGHVRFAREVMAPFWAAFSHAVRNAVAHGLEAPEARAAAGKPAHGSLTLRSRHAGDRVLVEIADDGGGIDWDAVRERATDAGLPALSLADLQAALFHDGLTTRRDADDHSGRGLGMGILRAECERLAGSITVLSAPGLGTTLCFSFPAAIVADVRGEPRPLQSQRRRSVGGKRDLQPRAGTGRR